MIHYVWPRNAHFIFVIKICFTTENADSFMVKAEWFRECFSKCGPCTAPWPQRKHIATLYFWEGSHVMRSTQNVLCVYLFVSIFATVFYSSSSNCLEVLWLSSHYGNICISNIDFVTRDPYFNYTQMFPRTVTSAHWSTTHRLLNTLSSSTSMILPNRVESRLSFTSTVSQK